MTSRLRRDQAHADDSRQESPLRVLWKLDVSPQRDTVSLEPDEGALICMSRNISDYTTLHETRICYTQNSFKHSTISGWS
jgi:hypothetical protein